MAYKILLIGDPLPDQTVTIKSLAEGQGVRFEVEAVGSLSAALRKLANNPADQPAAQIRISAVIVDLFLPDSQGIAPLAAILQASPNVPVLVVASLEHEPIAKRAVREGAQDYLLRSHLDAYWLRKTLEGMVE